MKYLKALKLETKINHYMYHIVAINKQYMYVFIYIYTFSIYIYIYIFPYYSISAISLVLIRFLNDDRFDLNCMFGL